MAKRKTAKKRRKPAEITGPNTPTRHKVKTWKEALSKLEKITRRNPRHWVFRGISSLDYALQSTLERCFDRWAGPKNRPLSRTDRQNVEDGMLRRFQRGAYRYIESPPEDYDRLEWLALMQHHGAPTRLLDFTYSFYIASFFALEGVHRKPGKRLSSCAVWAIPNWELCKVVRDELPPSARQRLDIDAAVDTHETAEAILLCGKKLVYQVTPRRVNERLAVQQGTFLTQTDLSGSFVECLSSINTKLKKGIHRIEMKFSQEELQCALTSLWKMNVNRTALFPGLDGFAHDMGIFGFHNGYRTTGGSWEKREKQMDDER